MLTFLARRVFVLLLTLLVASLVIFIILEVLPGDAALLILGIEAQADTLVALRAQMGLDRPAPVRYISWIGGLAVGQTGISHTYGVPVSQLISARLMVTVPLALIALVLSTAIAIPLGMLAATRRGRPGDYGVMGFSQIGMAIPNFWFAILSVLFFAVALGWFPASGFPGWEAGLKTALWALFLPAASLALPEAAILARVARTAVLDTLGADYVRTARAKGLAPRRVLWGHVLRNALGPMTTIIGLQFAFLLAGSIVVEAVFALPGLGRLIFQAVSQRDLMVLRDVILLLVALVVVVNFLVDIAHAVIDPRARYAA
ncbi:MAG: peptide ABC transporter [Rhodospirillaceae bacterium]|nr:peptide ABC transporter [Rhodospirillaceae bacterium]|tara:strand:- start:298 stop:1245 length:948 start_codon:yes stop_codon:yes gene_type:complete